MRNRVQKMLAKNHIYKAFKIINSPTERCDVIHCLIFAFRFLQQHPLLFGTYDAPKTTIVYNSTTIVTLL